MMNERQLNKEATSELENRFGMANRFKATP